MKRFIITESEKNNIRELYGLINEQEDIISQYVTDSRLKKILKEIENVLGEKFTKENFENEIKLSGKIKTESSGLLPEVVTAFDKIKNESGCNIFIKPVSHRTYETQKKMFINEGKGRPIGDRINFAMRRVAIPGYSQHHTGLAIDYGGNANCLIKKTWPNKDFNRPNKWGFKLPYMSGGNIRMKEPWHLYYVGN